ncbi:MAG: hypothetical protein ACYDCL_00300 [Myxococcales bacterium]
MIGEPVESLEQKLRAAQAHLRTTLPPMERLAADPSQLDAAGLRELAALILDAPRSRR